MPEVRFAILGPLDEDPDYAADCEALVAELGIGNAVQFAGRVDVAQWLPRIDLIALTSLSEAQPLVLMDGGACGVPVVGAAVGRRTAERRVGEECVRRSRSRGQ